MKMPYSNIIVFRMLTHNKTRLAMSLCGISFATLVLFMGMGFFNGLNDSQARIATILDADLIMMNNKTRTINSFHRIYRNRIFQATAFEEVTEVLPVYEGKADITNPQTKMTKSITYLAFPMDTIPFLIPGLKEYADALKHQGNILFDAESRAMFGEIEKGMDVDLNKIPHHVAGIVKLGPNFAVNGYVLMSDVTLFAGLRAKEFIRDKAAFGIIRVRPGTDIQTFKARLEKAFPEDFRFFTPKEMKDLEVNFTIRSTPVGAMLGVGLVVGFFIGVIISYQILFNEVTDHMPQFATMKAVGFSQQFLISIVMKEALLLSVMGFFPGMAASFALYTFIEGYTKIIMSLSPERILLVFVLTVIMCIIAGILAVRKVLKADPAELF